MSTVVPGWVHCHGGLGNGPGLTKMSGGMPKSIHGARGSAIVEPQSATRMRVRSENGAAVVGTFCASTRNVFVHVVPASFGGMGQVLTLLVSVPPLRTPTEVDEMLIPGGQALPSATKGTQSVIVVPAGIPGPMAGFSAPGGLELVR